MKQVSALMRWVGPVAIVGATFAVISDQLGLVVHLPEAGADTMGYHAVGSGLFLFVLTLLLVGMIGLYAGRGDSSGAKVIEYGDRHARYVLVEDYEEMERTLAPAGRRRSISKPGDESSKPGDGAKDRVPEDSPGDERRTAPGRLLGGGLLDELRLMVHPVILGGGKRLFEERVDREVLKLVDSRMFATGVVYLTYRPADEG